MTRSVAEAVGARTEPARPEPARPEPARPESARVGLVVNPLAGIGGPAGLKGSDGDAIVERALELGVVPHAGARASAAVSALLAAWDSGPGGLPLRILAAPGSMGEDAVLEAGGTPDVVGELAAVGRTSAADTRRIAAQMAAAGLDLLLVAGGDGTMRDACAALGDTVPVLGIPAGVKIHSGAFATSPHAAGELATAFLRTAAARRRTQPAEVLDLDEDAYRRGEVAPVLVGEVRVPVDRRRLQARKERSPLGEAAAARLTGLGVQRALAAGGRVVLGPGSTMRAVADVLGVPKTLVGVDVIDLAAGAAAATVVGADVTAAELERLVAERPSTLVVTPIGGQGFILGRGNQQVSAVVVERIAAAGRDAILVAATPGKLAALGGRPLLVDTGDARLDSALEGHLTVITGADDRAVYRVAAA